MGISDRQTLKHMKDPVRGVFRVSSWHDVYPGTPPPCNHIVGTISGPGIPDTTAEHKLDHHGHWPPGSELPIMIDRQDPSKYVILWDEAPRGIAGAMRTVMQSRQSAQDLFGAIQDAVAQQHQHHVPGDPVAMTSGTTMDMSQLPPDMAARVQAAMSGMFGAGGALGGASEAQIARLEHLAERLGGAKGARLSGIADALRQAAAGAGTAEATDFANPASSTFPQDIPQYGAPQYTAPPQGGSSGPQSGFAGPQGGFSGPQAGFAGPQGGFAGPQGGFSGPSQGGIAGPRGDFPALRTAGQPATAVVAEVTDAEPEFGTFPPPGGIVDLRLEITKPDGSFSIATTRIGFSSPEHRAAIAAVGNRLQVRLDPLNPANITIDPPDPS